MWSFHPHQGGVEKHVLKVSRILMAEGHEIRVFTFMHDQSLPAVAEYEGIKIYRFRWNNPAWWERKRVLYWFVRHHEFVEWADVIHSQGFFSWDWAFPLFRALWGSRRVFMTFHGYERGEFPPQRKVVLYRRAAARLTQGNISIGSYIPKWYGTPATFISHGGVDLPPEEPDLPSEESAVFIRRLEEDTGVLVYLEALRLLREREGTRLPFHIYGDGPLRGQVERTVAEFDLDAVTHGWLDDVDGATLPSRFAFTSGYLSILEAMVRKRLVFSVYLNALIKDYLLSLPHAERMIFIAGNAEELAQKVGYAMRHPDAVRTMVDRAYEFARCQTWQRVAGLYLRLWGQASDLGGGIEPGPASGAS
jgi:glycosyltransferase involved in cell wall biosynthesis